MRRSVRPVGSTRVIALLLVVIALCIASFYSGKWYERRYAVTEAEEHPLLAKRLFIENANDTIINFEPLRNKLRSELEYYGDKGASVYFEYLPTGTSIGIGDSTQMVGASLLKLPVVMDIYYLAENKKLDLDTQITLKEEWLDNQFGELYKKGSGYQTTIRELVILSIEQSDNTAINGLQAVVKNYNLDQSKNSFHALDVDFSDTEMKSLELSARAYSSFLKCLYFACYVSPDSSQEILAYLTKTKVGNERLPKYLPEEVPLAHKIGVTGENTQADCGIVYIENRNYVLCIMLTDTKEKGSEVIAQLSKRIYDYVAKNH